MRDEVFRSYLETTTMWPQMRAAVNLSLLTTMYHHQIPLSSIVSDLLTKTQEEVAYQAMNRLHRNYGLTLRLSYEAVRSDWSKAIRVLSYTFDAFRLVEIPEALGMRTAVQIFTIIRPLTDCSREYRHAVSRRLTTNADEIRRRVAKIVSEHTPFKCECAKKVLLGEFVGTPPELSMFSSLHHPCTSSFISGKKQEFTLHE